MSYKKYTIYSLILLFVSLGLIGGFVFFVDPYFHYHKPMLNYYVLNNQRYHNDGIAKNFDYDAIITGTSMTENFKTSELDRLFNVNSVKMSFSGGSFKEINDNLEVAINNNENVKMVVRCLDLYLLADCYDKMSYDSELYPTYLYDNDYFNDVNYLFNKLIIFESLDILIKDIKKEKSTTFDEYSSWNDNFIYSKEQVDLRYTRLDKSSEYNISNEDYENIKGNILINVVKLASEHPNIQFYYYFPPYSIYYWDKQNQVGNMKRQLDIIEYATELILEQPNIHLYSFIDEYDIVTNLNNYKDYEHHSGEINSLILQKMKNGEDLLSKNNYKDYFKNVRNYYYTHNYNQYFQ